MSNMLTRKSKLIKLIHVAKGKTKLCTCGNWIYNSPCTCGSKTEIPMDNDAYRAFIEGLTGKASTKDMNISELERVINTFRRKGFPSNFQLKAYMNDEKRRVISSINQRALEVMGEGWEKRITGFLKKVYKKDSLRFCSMSELRAAQGFINRVAKIGKNNNRR